MGKKLLTCVMALCLCLSFASCGEMFQPIDSTSGSSSSNQSSSDSSSDVEKQYVTITFKQEGQADIVKTIEQGASLTDIPTPVGKTGYNVAWDETDFTNVAESMVVSAVATAKTYTVILNVGAGAQIAQTSITVTYDQAYELPTPTHNDKSFKGWTYEGAAFAAQGTWTMDVEGDVTVTATWSVDWTGSY